MILLVPRHDDIPNFRKWLDPGQRHLAAQEAYDAVLRGWKGEVNAAAGRGSQAGATEGKRNAYLRVVPPGRGMPFILYQHVPYLSCYVVTQCCAWVCTAYLSVIPRRWFLYPQKGGSSFSAMETPVTRCNLRCREGFDALMEAMLTHVPCPPAYKVGTPPLKLDFDLAHDQQESESMPRSRWREYQAKRIKSGPPRYTSETLTLGECCRAEADPYQLTIRFSFCHPRLTLHGTWFCRQR